MHPLSGIGPPPAGNIEALRGRNDPDAIKAAAREMESLFVYEMIKVMRESTESTTGGLGSDTYGSMFDMELSRLMAERGFGLTDMLTKHIGTDTGKQAGLSVQNPLPHREPEKAGAASVKELLPAIESPEISSGYGMRTDPLSGEHRFHHGIDIAAAEGSEIHPAKPGTVLFSGEQHGYGNVVIVDHGDGFTSTYAHNQENLVRAGDQVDTDTAIARVGSTGRSTGPHIHFEVGYHGRHVDPKTLLAMR